MICRMAFTNILLHLIFIGTLVPIFADFVRFDRLPDFTRTEIPESLVLEQIEVKSHFHCLDQCKRNPSCYTVLVQDSKCYLVNNYLAMSLSNTPSPHTSGKPVAHYRIQTVCHPGWYSGGKSCYKTTSSSTLSQAVTSCNSIGASVVAIETEDENALLKDLLNKLNEDTAEYYIGINDCVQQGVMKYSVKHSEVVSFLDLVRTSRNPGDCCVVMNTDYNFAWTISPCAETSNKRLRGSICETNSSRK